MDDFGAFDHEGAKRFWLKGSSTMGAIFMFVQAY